MHKETVLLLALLISITTPAQELRGQEARSI
jgi:hypothetical protein